MHKKFAKLAMISGAAPVAVAAILAREAAARPVEGGRDVLDTIDGVAVDPHVAATLAHETKRA